MELKKIKILNLKNHKLIKKKKIILDILFYLTLTLGLLLAGYIGSLYDLPLWEPILGWATVFFLVYFLKIYFERKEK